MHFDMLHDTLYGCLDDWFHDIDTLVTRIGAHDTVDCIFDVIDTLVTHIDAHDIVDCIFDVIDMLVTRIDAHDMLYYYPHIEISDELKWCIYSYHLATGRKPMRTPSAHFVNVNISCIGKFEFWN